MEDKVQTILRHGQKKAKLWTYLGHKLDKFRTQTKDGQNQGYLEKHGAPKSTICPTPTWEYALTSVGVSVCPAAAIAIAKELDLTARVRVRRGGQAGMRD